MKPWYTSRTLWIGAAVVVLGALEALSTLELPAGWGSVVGVAMIALRAVTREGVTR